MAAMDRSGFGFLPVNACELANARDQRAKTQAVPHAIRPDLIVPIYRINSCGIPSRVETNISDEDSSVCAVPLIVGTITAVLTLRDETVKIVGVFVEILLPRMLGTSAVR